jgi:arabinose-5-phosphate isomerase
LDKLDYIAIANEVFDIEVDEVIKSKKYIDENFAKAIELILSIKGKVIITGVGKSGLIGAKMSATFASTGTSSFFIHPTEAMHGDLGMIESGDLVIAISYGGGSDELVKLIPHIKRFDIPLISISGNSESTLAKYADISLLTVIEKEACPLNTAPTSSTTVTLVLGDAIAVALMKGRNFQKEDFASFHPAGSLGKKLFVKISDLIRVNNLPIINKDATIQDAIFEISNGRIGNVLISDEKGILLAVLSDGDLRRALMDKDFNLSQKAINFANKNPKILYNKNMLAVDAMRFIEEHKIQLLIICNENNCIEGVLHIHDLIEAGIK